MGKRRRTHPGAGARPAVTRPEDRRGGDANAHYDVGEARRYTSQNDKVQAELTACALDLLVLQPVDASGPLLIADIGCGSGLSSRVIEHRGHVWVGLDASQAMLETATGEGAEGAVFRGDFSQGLPFKKQCFDGAVSVSAAQWLCQGDDEDVIAARLKRFFASLHEMLRPGARACLQVYPRDVNETRRLEKAMQASGLVGCAVTAFPHANNAKKIFLCCVRDPRPSREERTKYWQGMQDGLMSRFQPGGLDFDKLPGGRRNHCSRWLTEGWPTCLEDDGSKTWMRRGDDADIGFVPQRRGVTHMCEHLDNESIWINSWDRGCARCPLGWPHATTCVRAWRQFLHHYRLLGTGEYWQQEFDGVYPYEEEGTDILNLRGQAELRDVQMHKQWNRRLMRMLRRARSMIREPGRATGGWNMLPLDLAVEEDFGLRPEVIDVSYVNGIYEEGGTRAESDGERRERNDEVVNRAEDEWKGHVLPCHNQVGVDGFPVITAHMPHGCHRYGRPLARKDRVRAGTLLPGPLESSEPQRTPLNEANAFRFRATSELNFFDMMYTHGLGMDRSEWDNFAETVGKREWDPAIVLMQEGYFDADSSCGTLGAFVVEVSWPDGEGSDEKIGRTLTEETVTSMAAEMSSAVSHFLQNECHRAVACVDVIHCTRDADSFPGMVNNDTVAAKSASDDRWNRWRGDGKKTRVHTVQIWALWWPQTLVGGATDFPTPFPLQDNEMLFTFLARTLLGHRNPGTLVESTGVPTFPFTVTPVREAIIPALSTVLPAYIEFDGPLDVVRKQLMRGAKQYRAPDTKFFLRCAS